ncbi:MAG: 50S ribosomal protein L9 [Gemmatimonadetes bacterium]|nr:50S ribosomal protein L9 [Gemmatimonadota bacterium]
MDVILTSDVAHLGKAGEVVRVKDGYARNFLIPGGLAYHATEANKRRMTAEEGRRASRAASEQSVAEERAAQLRQVSLTFTAKAGDGDRLFGSITVADIAQKLAEAGHKIDKRSIELEEPIRAIGVYQVAVRLHPAVRADVRVWVARE